MVIVHFAEGTSEHLDLELLEGSMAVGDQLDGVILGFWEAHHGLEVDPHHAGGADPRKGPHMVGHGDVAHVMHAPAHKAPSPIRLVLAEGKFRQGFIKIQPVIQVGLLKEGTKFVKNLRFMVKSHVEGCLAAVFKVGISEGLGAKSVFLSVRSHVVDKQPQVKAVIGFIIGGDQHFEWGQQFILFHAGINGIEHEGDVFQCADLPGISYRSAHVGIVGQQMKVQGDFNVGIDADGCVKPEQDVIGISGGLKGQVSRTGNIVGEVSH